MITMTRCSQDHQTQHEEPLVHLRPVTDFEKNLFLEYWNDKLVDTITELREELEQYKREIGDKGAQAIKENESLRRRNNSLRKTNNELIMKLLHKS